MDAETFKKSTERIKSGSELANALLALWRLFNDPAVPAWAKAIVLAALAYFVMPFDAVPDLVFPVGFADDLAVALAALAAVGAQATNTSRPGTYDAE